MGYGNKSISDWAEEVHANRRRLGWYDGLPEKCRDPLVLSNRIAHIMREAGEAWEELRSNRLEMRLEGSAGSIPFNDATPQDMEVGKPEGMVVELADVVLLALDLAELAGLDIEQAMRQKMYFNETRPTLEQMKARGNVKLF